MFRILAMRLDWTAELMFFLSGWAMISSWQCNHCPGTRIRFPSPDSCVPQPNPLRLPCILGVVLVASDPMVRFMASLPHCTCPPRYSNASNGVGHSASSNGLGYSGVDCVLCGVAGVSVVVACHGVVGDDEFFFWSWIDGE